MKRLGLATAALALALCSVAAAQGAPPAQDEPNTLLDAPPIQRAPAARTAPRYFIDFRARSALSYGHTFVVFGRVGERLTPRNVAGLHPKGDSSITYIFGHLLPVDSETGASDGDLDEQYTTARYRVWLTAVGVPRSGPPYPRAASEFTDVARRDVQLQCLRRHHRAFRRAQLTADLAVPRRFRQQHAPDERGTPALCCLRRARATRWRVTSTNRR